MNIEYRTTNIELRSGFRNKCGMTPHQITAGAYFVRGKQ